MESIPRENKMIIYMVLIQWKTFSLCCLSEHIHYNEIWSRLGYTIFLKSLNFVTPSLKMVPLITCMQKYPVNANVFRLRRLPLPACVPGPSHCRNVLFLACKSTMFYQHNGKAKLLCIWVEISKINNTKFWKRLNITRGTKSSFSLFSVINYVIMMSQCAQCTSKIHTIKKTGILTIVIVCRYNNCNIQRRIFTTLCDTAWNQGQQIGCGISWFSLCQPPPPPQTKYVSSDIE